MHRIDAWRMIQRRAAAMGLKTRINCHTFRATGITAYMDAGGTLENAQRMAAHESPRRPSSMTAPATQSHSMRSSGSGFSAGEGRRAMDAHSRVIEIMIEAMQTIAKEK
jgi:hypothetical protein